MEHYQEESPVKKVLLGVALAAAVAGGAFGAWQYVEHGRANREMAVAARVMERTQAELAAAKNEIIALRKELVEQKTALDQARSDLAMAASILEAEKAVGVRLRQEMIALRDQVNATRRASGKPVPVEQLSRPPLVKPSGLPK